MRKIIIGLIMALAVTLFIVAGYIWSKDKTDKVTSGSSDPARGYTKADLTKRMLKAQDKPYDVTLSSNTLADLNGMVLELTAPGTVMVNHPFDIFACITTSTSSLFLPVLAIPDKFTSALTGERITADSPTEPHYNFTYPPPAQPPVMPTLYPYMGGNIPAVIWAGVPATYQTGYHFVNLVDNIQDRHWLSADRMNIFEWHGDNITWHFSGLTAAECGDYKFGLFVNAFWEDSLTGEYRSGFITMEEPLSVQPVVTIPIAPSNLIATAVSQSEINLMWQDNSDNEDFFNIDRRTIDTPYIRLATLAANTTSFSDTGLEAGTTYFYLVSASNVAGNSPYSNETFATTLPPPILIPIAPSYLQVLKISPSEIIIVWDDNSDNESGFKIERSLDGVVFTEIAFTDADSNYYYDSGLTSDTYYYYRVSAYNAWGFSDYTDVADGTTWTTIGDLGNIITEMRAQNIITHGMFVSFMAKVNAALASDERGNNEVAIGDYKAAMGDYNTACNQLRALYNEIEASLDRFTPVEEGAKLLSKTDKATKEEKIKKARSDAKDKILIAKEEQIEYLLTEIEKTKRELEKKNLTPEQREKLNKKLKELEDAIKKVYEAWWEGMFALQPELSEKPYGKDDSHMPVISQWVYDRIWQAYPTSLGWEGKGNAVGGTTDPKTGIIEVPPEEWKSTPQRSGKVTIKYTATSPPGTKVETRITVKGSGATGRLDKNIIKNEPPNIEEGEYTIGTSLGNQCDLIYIHIEVGQVEKIGEQKIFIPYCSIKLLIHLGPKITENK